ncbi:MULTISPECIES: recombinase family protein [unclassified Actinoplanes]|uniref:recombinase family protein n=1 Tax=unclassified Actinoplanes TaxID=2626549 RepID=UPI0012FBCF4C|nr:MULTISPECIES: recombinase family protein [unclassified Actinoplanes]
MFLGRMSTDDRQDPVSSRAWQREAVGWLIAGRGRIVAEYFDVGVSRSAPWRDRPQAAALLAEAARPDRRFDAVVVAEFERAFSGSQARPIIAELNAYGVQVWLPEVEGPVDLTDVEHRALLRALGYQSQREVLRNRTRTRAAMAVQVRDQGRSMGGRPPYGYRLVAVGSHPKKRHAQGPAGVPVRGGAGDGPAGAVDVREAVAGMERGGDRPEFERAWCALARGL